MPNRKHQGCQYNQKALAQAPANKKNQIKEWTGQWAEKANIPFFWELKVSSTNDQAKQAAFATSPAMFMAKTQTRGRGREGRKWQDSDLMLSWCWKINYPLSQKTTYFMGQALKKAFSVTWPLAFKIKKPNDIYLEQKKLAGILVELVSYTPGRHRLILGAGLNVWHTPETKFACLQAFLNHPITQNQWHTFLSHWKREMEKTLPRCRI